MARVGESVEKGLEVKDERARMGFWGGKKKGGRGKKKGEEVSNATFRRSFDFCRPYVHFLARVSEKLRGRQGAKRRKRGRHKRTERRQMEILLSKRLE
ncbi:MAG: hypothetical protein ACFFBS_04995 [Promethearchaeota archaeon]